MCTCQSVNRQWSSLLVSIFHSSSGISKYRPTVYQYQSGKTQITTV